MACVHAYMCTCVCVCVYMCTRVCVCTCVSGTCSKQRQLTIALKKVEILSSEVRMVVLWCGVVWWSTYICVYVRTYVAVYICTH